MTMDSAHTGMCVPLHLRLIELIIRGTFAESVALVILDRNRRAIFAVGCLRRSDAVELKRLSLGHVGGSCLRRGGQAELPSSLLPWPAACPPHERAPDRGLRALTPAPFRRRG